MILAYANKSETYTIKSGMMILSRINAKYTFSTA